jgi:phosphoenolpyruvate carboxylase
VEQSLWKAVPHYLRRVSSALKKVRYSDCFYWIYHLFGSQKKKSQPFFSILHLQHTGSPLPLTCTPIKFGSWMGGDRDGNPNVTAKVRYQGLGAFSLSCTIDYCNGLMESSLL